jgi:membrane protein YqaA with SNARE-associated domain
MNGLVTWIKTFALGLGGLGLFIVACIDSSFLTLPEINDILIVVLVTRHPRWLVFYAAMQALGSVAGSSVLYWLSKKGGEAFLRRRFTADRVERGLSLIRRYGALTLLVSSLLPPPTPFKLFVLLAGALGMKLWPFVCSVGLGRFGRYFGEGLLAVWYGEAALAYIKAHGGRLALIVAMVLAGVGCAWLVSRRYRASFARRMTATRADASPDRGADGRGLL